MLLRGGTARSGLLWHGAAVITLLAVFGPSLTQHALHASRPLVFNDDARAQVWPFFRYHPHGIERDYIGDYYLRAFFPLGYRALISGLATAVDPAVISKVLPYFALASFLVLIGFAARHLAGTFGAWAAVALALSSGLPLARMVGGLPRAFAFPALGLAVFGLASGNVYALAGAVLLGAAFYPAATIAPALALACWLLVFPARFRGSAAEWTLSRRLLVGGLTAAIASVLLAPSFLGARRYGQLVTPAQVGEYPETGPQGRHGPRDRVPPPPLLPTAARFLTRAVVTSGPTFSPARESLKEAGVMSYVPFALLGVAGAGVISAARRSADLRGPLLRLALLLALAPTCYALAARAAPFLFYPDRHVAYALPTLVFVLVPVGLLGWGTLLARGRPAWSVAASLFLLAILLGLTGGRVARDSALTVNVEHFGRLYEFLERLPGDVLVAGWPRHEIENVPFASRKPVLLSFETHVPFHTAYLDEMRVRMRALIAATFATDLGSLQALRDEFGVTHLLVRKEYYRSAPPTYFAPFTGEVAKAQRRGRRNGFVVPGLPTVYDDGNVVVIDLRQVATEGQR